MTREERRTAKKKYRDKNPVYREKEKHRQAVARMERKRRVLSHYGKNKKHQCKWRGCEVSDIDMLSIDHIDDSGAKHRKALGSPNYSRGNAPDFYRWLESHSFPKGFQTLCCNHQWKKEILRRRARITHV